MSRREHAAAYLGMWNPVAVLAGTIAGYVAALALAWQGWGAVAVVLAGALAATALRLWCIARRPGR